MEISKEKTYVTRNGCAVRILCTDAVGSINPVIGLIKSGNSEIVGKWGINGANQNSSLDLCEVTPWDKIKVDAPVYVRNSLADAWKHAHFAGVTDGMPCVWSNGGTSFTTPHSVGYKYCTVGT